MSAKKRHCLQRRGQRTPVISVQRQLKGGTVGTAGMPHRERLKVMGCRAHGSKKAHMDLPQTKGKNVLYTAAKQHKPSEKTEQTLLHRWGEQTGQLTCAYTHTDTKSALWQSKRWGRTVLQLNQIEYKSFWSDGCSKHLWFIKSTLSMTFIKRETFTIP